MEVGISAPVFHMWSPWQEFMVLWRFAPEGIGRERPKYVWSRYILDAEYM